jgi:hypothetical protein
MSGVCLDDVRRAQETRDPGLFGLIGTLTTAPDAAPEEAVREGALSFTQFAQELSSWRYLSKSKEAKAQYRQESWKILEAPDAEYPLPERLKLHEVVLELWADNGPWAREALLEIIERVPLRWGPWRGLKQIFKEAEARGDYEIYGALAARVDFELAGSGYFPEVKRQTLSYMARRAWRTLRRLGQTLPAVYAEAAVEVLRFYPANTNWNKTWIANHIFFHQTKNYTQSGWRTWRLPKSLLEKRAFAAAWQRTPRPLFTLLERAKSERARLFAVEALKADFRTALREVDASWAARLAGVDSGTAHEFLVWLLKNVPKFEEASFRQMGLHDAVLLLLDSPSNEARAYAATYARTHARDLPLEEIVRLINNSHAEVRKLALDLLNGRDPRAEVGLDAWGQLLGTNYGHDAAMAALRKHFGASELTPEWFRERLLSDAQKVYRFAQEQLPKVHPLKSLGHRYMTSLFDDERLGRDTALWALNRLLDTFDVTQVEDVFWRRSLIHPLSRDTVRQWIREDKLKARAFGVEFWKSLAFLPSFESDAWIREQKESGLAWARELRFDAAGAQFARELLGDVRQFSAKEIGLEWLMLLVDRLESEYHNFAVDYMIKAMVPADFAPAEEAAAPVVAAVPSTISLDGKQFLFTGDMATMVREDAQKTVESLGGVNAKSVTKTLDYLVVGDQGSPLYGNGKKGSKILKAEEYQQKGLPVKIISETAFLQMLAGGAPAPVDSDAALAGCEALWEMAVGAGDESTPRRQFALQYVRRHHLDICQVLTERQVDPGAEIPRDFLTFERALPLFDDERRGVRQLALDLARWELARWSPSLEVIVGLCELPYPEVCQFFEKAFMAAEGKETKAYRLGRDKLTVEGVYAFCESMHRATRRLGMAIIARYSDLAVPQALFRLTESPDRQLRAFVIRTIWSLYRDRGITPTWRPAPVEVRFAKVKTKKGPQEVETGPGPLPRPQEWPAELGELQEFLRRTLFGLPPAKLDTQEVQKPQSKRARPMPARRAKQDLIEVLRDLGMEDASFAALLAPLLEEFMRSLGKSEREACLVALVRLDRAHNLGVAALN